MLRFSLLLLPLSSLLACLLSHDLIELLIMSEVFSGEMSYALRFRIGAGLMVGRIGMTF